MKIVKKDRTKNNLKLYAIVLIVIWTILVSISLIWNMTLANNETYDYAYVYTTIAFEKDVLYRLWNTSHGGVYVPVTDSTPPNPYLAKIPERDIITPSGKRLTLMNPAYMTRQAHELERQISGARGHITSLKPIRPENRPDEWEKNALYAFEKGEKEVFAKDIINSKEYFRLMRPFVIDKKCLKCHAFQGYKENDIRGGISISLPVDTIEG
jgi:hypothetical protein